MEVSQGVLILLAILVILFYIAVFAVGVLSLIHI